MDWLARYIDKLDRDISELKAEFRAAETRIGARIDQALGEMRHLDGQRHQEFLVLDNRLSEERKWLIGLVVGAILNLIGIGISLFKT